MCVFLDRRKSIFTSTERSQDQDELYSASIDGDALDKDSDKAKEDAMTQQKETAV